MATQTQTQTLQPATFHGLEASRYQTKQSFVATSLSINKPEEVKPMMEGLRKLFATDYTTSRDWRMNQLLALKRLLQEGGDQIRAAMKKDLGKSAFESNISEIDLTMSEVVYAISHLDSWMAKQPRAISPLNQPGVGCVSYSLRGGGGLVKKN